MNHYIKTNKEHVENQFWIDRRGKVQKYIGAIPANEILSVHWEIANQHFPCAPMPEAAAELAGWIKIHHSVTGRHYAWKQPTKAQYNRLESMKQLEWLELRGKK